MHNKKTKAAEKARIAAEQAQEKVDEMATTSKYEVDDALRKASRAAPPLATPGRASHAAKER